MTGPDDSEEFAAFAADLRQTFAASFMPAPDLHERAAAEAWRLDEAYFAEHPDAEHFERPAIPHEVCTAAGWCRDDPLEDLAPCPEGMRRFLVAIITRSDGDDGARTKVFGVRTEPTAGGGT